MNEAHPQRLYREPEEKKLAGVCGGLADYFGLDPTVVRLAAVVIAVVTGFAGVVAYIVAALVIPRRPDTVPRMQAPPPEWQQGRGKNSAVLIGLLILAMLLLAGGHWRWWWGDAPVFGGILIAVGIWLLATHDESRSAPAAGMPAGPADHPVDLADQPMDRPFDRPVGEMPTAPTTMSDPPTTLTGEAASASPQGETPPPIAPWGHGLSSRVLALLLLVAGAVAFLAVFDAWDVNFQEALGIGLLVVGAGMVVGAWRGRSRGLLALGLPILLLLVAADAIDLPLKGGSGDRRIEVDTVSELQRLDPTQELTAGELVVDLTDAPLARTGAWRRQLAADVGFGNLVVRLPEGVRADIDAHVGLGDIRVDDQEESGVNVDRAVVLTGEPGGGTIALDLHVGLGEIEVTHG